MCSKKRTVLREGSFQEQITSLEQFPSIFLHPMKAIVFFYPSNIICKVHSFENWGIPLDIQSRDSFRPIVRAEAKIVDLL